MKRKVYYIDVGNMSPKEAEEYIRNLMDKPKKSKWVEFLEFFGIAGILMS